MAKTTRIDRTQLDRYHPVRTVRMEQTVSFSDRGSLAVSADLMDDWPAEQQFVVIYAGPGGASIRTHLYLEPAGPDDRDSLKIQRDDHGSAKCNGKAAIHQFGLDDIDGCRRCPAGWVDGLLVADIEAATFLPRHRPPTAPGKASGEVSRVWEGKMRCPDCGKEVAYRMNGGSRVTRTHKDPDGLPCGGGDGD